MTRIVKRKKRRNSIEPKYDKKINNLMENKNNNQDDYAVHSRETVVIDEVVSLLEGDVKQNKLNDHPHNPKPKPKHKPKPKPKPKHNNNQQPHSTDVKHRRFSIEEKHKIKKEKKKMEKQEKKRKQAQKVIEKLKELKETKKKAKWEARKGQIKKACRLGFSIGLIAVEIVLLCL